MLTRTQVDKAERLWREGRPRTAIAEALGCMYGELEYAMKKAGSRFPKNHGKKRGEKPLP